MIDFELDRSEASIREENTPQDDHQRVLIQS